MARAQLLVRLKQPQEAQKDVDAARKFSGNSPFLTYTQALIYFNLGKLREAYATVQLSLRMAPEYRPAQLLYAALSYSTGALGQAEQALTELARDFPQDAYVRKLLAATLIARRDGKRALEVIEPMLSKDLLDTVVMEIAGDAYMAAGEYDKAALYMERAAASDPKNARLRTGVAMVRLSAGEVDKAVGDLEAAAKLEGGAERAKVILILTHLTSGKYDKALEEAHSLLEKQPKEPLAHFLLGAVYAGKKDDAQARASFERSLALRADYLPAAEKLARMDMAEKKLDAAQKTMEAALAASKDNIQAIILLSEILAAKGDTNAAVAMLERARKASKGAIEPRARLAAYYARIGDNAKALEIAQETLSANPDNPAALQLVGMARTMAGDTNSAQAVLAKAVAADPKSAQARNNLAAAQVAGGRLADAEANYRKAIELQPEFLGARLALCALLIKTQRPDEALGMVPEMRKKYPKSADVHMLEGDALMQKKKYPEALQAYESAMSLAKSGALAVKVYMARARAKNADTALTWLAGWVKDNPQNHEARSYLADGLLVVGQTKAAIEHYDYLVQQAPGDAMGLNNLANALSRLKDPRALDTAEKAYKLVPDNPLVADTLGWLLLEQGDKARAVELLRKAAASGLPEIRYHLGAGLARTGDKSGARKQLEDLLKSGAPFPQKKEAEALLRQL